MYYFQEAAKELMLTVFLNPHAFQFIFSNKLGERGVIGGSRIGTYRARNLDGFGPIGFNFFIKYLISMDLVIFKY